VENGNIVKRASKLSIELEETKNIGERLLKNLINICGPEEEWEAVVQRVREKSTPEDRELLDICELIEKLRNLVKR